MTPYKNLNGDSNVVAFQLNDQAITVKFREPSKSGYDTYVYSESSAGSYHVEQMKQLAVAGSGLNGYINENVREKYESRS